MVKTLATRHQLSTKPAKDHLLQRLADNETTLQEVRKLLTDSIKRKYQVTPAGEWLIDNFYLIEEHIRIAKTHFPKNYSEGLPQLVNETSSGTTRSYAEVVIAPTASDLMQPAFSNLFVQTEILSHQNTIFCTRRPRSADEKAPWMFHLMAIEGKAAEEVSYETDRMAFIGHGNSIVDPQAMNNPGVNLAAARDPC